MLRPRRNWLHLSRVARKTSREVERKTVQIKEEPSTNKKDGPEPPKAVLIDPPG